MSTEFNELLPRPVVPILEPASWDAPPLNEQIQIWLIGSREQGQHGINKLDVKRVATKQK